MFLGRSFRFILQSLPPASKIRFLAMMGATAAYILALLAQPLIVASIVRDVSGGSGIDNIRLMLGLLALAMVATAVFSHLLALCNNAVLQDVRHSTKTRLYSYFLSRSGDFFRDRNEGWIEASVATASQAARTIVYDCVGALVRIVFFILFSAALIALTDPILGTVFVIAAGIYLILSYELAHGASRNISDAVASTAALSAEATDILANIETIQLANTRAFEEQRIGSYLDVERTTYIHAQGRIGRSEFIQRLYLIGVFTFFVAATAFLASGNAPAAIMFYIVGLIAYTQLDMTGKALNSLFEMAHKLSAVLNAIEYPDQPFLIGEAGSNLPTNTFIMIDHLGFAYPEAPLIISNLSLRLEPGAHVIVRGPSGQGKSTLLKLISGQLEPSSGSITIGGIKATALPPAGRAATMTVISQHAPLFDRTLYENACYGCGNVARERVEEALLSLGLMPLRERSGPDWLDRRINKNGLGLSGGERQRVLIARAILAARPILVLDEATSALDSESEACVFAAIHNNLPNATIIAVSHHIHAHLAGYQMFDLEVKQFHESRCGSRRIPPQSFDPTTAFVLGEDIDRTKLVNGQKY